MTDLLPEARKTLRRLTRAYLARPDPVSWLVAADLLEENGRDAEAARWRRRAEWFDLVRTEVAQSLDEWPAWKPYTGPVREVHLGPFGVRMRRRGLCLRVWAVANTEAGCRYLPSGHPLQFTSVWRVWVADSERHFNAKVITLIDDLHDNPL